MNALLYSDRRRQLLQAIHAGYAVTAFDAMQQTNDSAAPFIQEASFYYLTGINEPGWQLFVTKEGVETLLAPEISETHRIFDGGISNDQATQISGVLSVLSAKAATVFKENFFASEKSVGVIGPDPYESHHSFSMNPAPKALFETVKKHSSETIEIRKPLAQLRAIKSEDEIKAIRQAITYTNDAFSLTKKKLQTLAYEYSVEAEFSYAFRSAGVVHAYEPIVASGKNACTLHYQKNSDQLPENGLILLDIGARYEGYAADITRTYAIGAPSDREIAVHAAVEKAHHEIIDLITPGYSVKEYHEAVDVIMRRALEELSLLKKEDDYRTYFPHAISHGLGLDVHDSLGGPKVFEPGMVLTVEPGIYIPEEGIGVRIEDDILVTETGHENLSAGLPTSL